MTLRQGRVIGTTGHTLTGTHGIADIDQPQPQAPLDLDAIAEFNANQRRARDAYYDTPDTYARRTAASLKSQRYRERKKEQQ